MFAAPASFPGLADRGLRRGAKSLPMPRMSESDKASTPPASPFEAYPESYPDDGPRAHQSWPLVFGGISLAIGVFGLCLQGLMGVSVFANDWMMSNMGIETTPPPPIMRWSAGLQAAILVPLGFVLIAGAAMLLVRRPLGAKLVLAWAAARLVMVLVGLGVGVATIKPQAAWSVTLIAEMRDGLRKQGRKEEQLPPLIDQEKAESDGIRNIAIFSLAFAVWPAAMILLLTRAKAKADIESWKAAGRT